MVATIKEWPADKIERRAVDSLIPYARNSRTHSDEQVAQIAASIKEWGWTTPILVSEDGTIIAGHGRVMAARKLGIKDAPVIVARGWSEAQIRAYVIADNKLALNAGWDETLLSEELRALGDLGLNLDDIGFSADEISALTFEPMFRPGSDADQGKLDELAPKIVKCPHCQKEFDLRKNG